MVAGEVHASSWHMFTSKTTIQKDIKTMHIIIKTIHTHMIASNVLEA